MKPRPFADILREELRARGLWTWAAARPYSEVIGKPEVLLAHEAAWRKHLATEGKTQ